MAKRNASDAPKKQAQAKTAQVQKARVQKTQPTTVQAEAQTEMVRQAKKRGATLTARVNRVAGQVAGIGRMIGKRTLLRRCAESDRGGAFRSRCAGRRGFDSPSRIVRHRSRNRNRARMRQTHDFRRAFSRSANRAQALPALKFERRIECRIEYSKAAKSASCKR